jgi:4-hydroxy-3-methylbut-2-en-1-yl diphosphate reductase
MANPSGGVSDRRETPSAQPGCGTALEASAVRGRVGSALSPLPPQPRIRFHFMAGTDEPSTYYRKGFGLKADVQGDLSADYNARIVDALREHEYTLIVEDITVRLASEFGFCYGVERAVEYAYQTRRKFPDRRLLLVGEIIHNPHVNAKLRGMGIEILEPNADGVFDFSGVRTEDVVILPAFGVTMAAFEALRAIGCVLVDTTCGSVLNVWKRVEAYARDGYTALIHGKYYHEETRATASQVLKYPGGAYLVVRDMTEAHEVCDYLEGRGNRDAFLAKFARAASPGFDPDVHLRRIGVANQTTMLARESLAIGEEVGRAIVRARGEEARVADFRTFDTICSATQERQDAVLALLEEPLTAMIVVGGFNSSNTISLAALCDERVPTYHIEDASGIDPDAGTVHYRRAGIKHVEATAAGWLPAVGPLRVGLTAGASTPNNKIGETVARILATRGVVLQTA